MKKTIPVILGLFIAVLAFLSPSSLHADIYTDARVLSSTLLNLQNRYVDTVDVDNLTEVAVRAMLKELDPHSTYLTPKEVSQMNEGLGGSFEGIGVRYQMENDTLLIISTVTGGPSEKVGILAGDHIIMVGDSTIAGQKFDTQEIQRRLRGPKGSIAEIGILRRGETGLLWFNVTRDKIPVYSVDASYMIRPGIGYIRIARFAQTTPSEVKQAMDSLQKKGMQRLIIDLQDNGGGYLNSAVDLSSLFLPSGEVAVYTEGRSDSHRDYVTRGFSHFKGPLVVLINEQSASASEIFSGCMQDLDRGLIVGRRSFGKGLVQSPIMMPNGGMIRLTVSHYFTPSGRCIQKPYKNGDQKSYNEDLLNRLHRGELVSADSIHLADSLRYYTRDGRIVYGGGGIMPDVFVPLDTVLISRTHRAVIAKGSINKFILQYFKENQAELHRQYPTLDSYLDDKTGFKLSNVLVDGVLDQARRDSVQCDSLDELRNNEVFRLQLQALLANDLYENGAYIRIMNGTSAIVREGLSLILDDKRYKQLLTK